MHLGCFEDVLRGVHDPLWCEEPSDCQHVVLARGVIAPWLQRRFVRGRFVVVRLRWRHGVGGGGGGMGGRGTRAILSSRRRGGCLLFTIETLCV